jgi:DNA ligase-associated metallophosphoesterase
MSSQCEIDFVGNRFVLDAGLSLYWPDKATLIVSDLHLEKASFLAQFGSAVAPYDTLDTLMRLEALIVKYQPTTLILLGDSFHDRGAWERLEETSRQRFLSICHSVETCHLVEGNHDLGLLKDARFKFTTEVEVDNIVFRHEPQTGPLPQIIGHFHPKLRTILYGQRLTGKVFAVNSSLMIMPAFGSFTGGLDLTNDVFSSLAKNDPFRAYMVHKQTVAGISRDGR